MSPPPVRGPRLPGSPRLGVALTCALAVGSLGPLPGRAKAQTLDLDVALTQAFTSVAALGSPAGFAAAVTGHGVLGRLGLRVGYRSLTEGGGEVSRVCGLFCTEGPFDRSHHLRTLQVGLLVDVPAPLPGTLAVGLGGSMSWQKERLEHLAGGESFDDAKTGPDRGLGAHVDWRFGPVARRLHPFVYAQYDRITGPGECLADAACFEARDVASLGLGIAWRPG